MDMWGRIILWCCATVLCIAGWLAASLASPHEMPLAFVSIKMLRHYQMVAWRVFVQKTSWLRAAGLKKDSLFISSGGKGNLFPIRAQVPPFVSLPQSGSLPHSWPLAPVRGGIQANQVHTGARDGISFLRPETRQGTGCLSEVREWGWKLGRNPTVATTTAS